MCLIKHYSMRNTLLDATSKHFLVNAMYYKYGKRSLTRIVLGQTKTDDQWIVEL